MNDDKWSWKNVKWMDRLLKKCNCKMGRQCVTAQRNDCCEKLKVPLVLSGTESKDSSCEDGIKPGLY